MEIDPVEVIARAKPQKPVVPLATQEQNVFDQETVSVANFQAYMRNNNLALIVSRNLTTRDKADTQQPFNLRITGMTTETISKPGKIYDISFLQIFQADALRGYTFHSNTPEAGRRLFANQMHDPAVHNPPAAGSPAGGVQLGSDGSMAAFVPARRAMTWQTTSQSGTPGSRERYWLSFQPGEIRTCTSCHGINENSQSNQPAPTNEPEALHTLLQYWKANGGGNFPPAPTIMSGPTAAPIQL